MKKRTLFVVFAALTSICSLADSNLYAQQTIQLKEPALKVSDDKTATDSKLSDNNAQESSSHSVVIETQTLPNGKVRQTKKVWSNGKLVKEETKELDSFPDDQLAGQGMTIQLPDGFVSPGDLFNSQINNGDFDGGFPGESFGSSFKQFEEQIKRHQEQLLRQFEGLRRQLGAAHPELQDDLNIGVDAVPQSNVVNSSYWLGVGIAPVPSILIAHLPEDYKSGVFVQYVHPISPAGKVGIKQFDVLTSIQGESLNSPVQVTELIEKYGGQEVEIEFYRKGKLEKVKVTIEKRPEEFSSLVDGSQNPGRKIQVVRPGVIVSEGRDLQPGDEESQATGEEDKNSDK